MLKSHPWRYRVSRTSGRLSSGTSSLRALCPAVQLILICSSSNKYTNDGISPRRIGVLRNGRSWKDRYGPGVDWSARQPSMTALIWSSPFASWRRCSHSFILSSVLSSSDLGNLVKMSDILFWGNRPMRITEQSKCGCYRGYIPQSRMAVQGIKSRQIIKMRSTFSPHRCRQDCWSVICTLSYVRRRKSGIMTPKNTVSLIMPKCLENAW